jgi:hypothetical protein
VSWIVIQPRPDQAAIASVPRLAKQAFTVPRFEGEDPVIASALLRLPSRLAAALTMATRHSRIAAKAVTDDPDRDTYSLSSPASDQ